MSIFLSLWIIIFLPSLLLEASERIWQQGYGFPGPEISLSASVRRMAYSPGTILIDMCCPEVIIKSDPL